MKLYFLLFIFVVLFSLQSIRSFQEWWENSKVFELDIENFLDTVGKEKYVIVKFYTKWCGYCRLLSPIYEKFYKKMKKKRKDFIVARLEGENNFEICEEYGIHSFPKVAIFYPHSLEIKDFFSDQRTVEDLFAWVEQHSPFKKNPNDNSNLRFIGDDEEEVIEQESIQTGLENIKLDNNKEITINITNGTNTDYPNKLEQLKESFNSTKARYEKLYDQFLILKSEIKQKLQNNTMDTASEVINETTSGIITDTPLMDEPEFEYENFDIIVVALIIFVLLFGFIIVRKVYNKIIK